jgi:hypothetical protein
MLYGRFVYVSAVKFKLSILNPVHKAGIRFAIGIFRYSPLKSLNVELGGTPFSLWRNLIVYSYMPKLPTLFIPPSFGVGFNLS